MIINSFFTISGLPATGLLPTIRIWQVTTGAQVLVVTNAQMIEVGDGFYKYVFTSYNSSFDYVFRCDGTGVLSDGERYQAGSTSTVQLESSTLIDIASEVWEEPLSAHTNVGSAGYTLTQVKADTLSIVISQSAISSLISTLLKYERNRTRIDTVANTLTIYDDDCSTILTVFDLIDSHGNPSILEVAERKPVGCP